ncbi:hypothetical protein BV22DRAFT_155693 [Leucogyrophana mollusca]|uniref:Uncharacterized protein n=1 Tax=Leucogyrophana mollusca TaxID=85980 RepID=A0ACB8BT09_9AGAM|nr:hypothetical protein BV22DRAFT_155693 [Leucogyrophana mollusca]
MLMRRAVKGPALWCVRMDEVVVEQGIAIRRIRQSSVVRRGCAYPVEDVESIGFLHDCAQQPKESSGFFPIRNCEAHIEYPEERIREVLDPSCTSVRRSRHRICHSLRSRLEAYQATDGDLRHPRYRVHDITPSLFVVVVSVGRDPSLAIAPHSLRSQHFLERPSPPKP